MQGDVIKKSSSAPAELSKLNTWSHTNWAWRNKLSSVSVVSPLDGTMVWKINTQFGDIEQVSLNSKTSEFYLGYPVQISAKAW